MGIVPEKAIQIESMDDGLRNRLWNLFYDYLIGNHVIKSSDDSDFTRRYGEYITNFVIDYCGNFKKIPTDFLKKRAFEFERYSIGIMYVVKNIKGDFTQFKWNRVLDFIEYFINFLREGEKKDYLIKKLNSVLEEEKSGYRFIVNQITPITNEIEISAIKEATSFEDKLKVVSDHTKKALEHYSDRENPDYINSIKESINAVEAMAKIISGNKNHTLGEALDDIVRSGKLEINAALHKAYKAIYGWTSNEGIRHSKTEGDINVNPEDAKYMLVSCSAFVNYLKEKAVKVGIEF